MKRLRLDRKSIPKLAVVAAGLTAAVVVGTMTPAPAQASPGYATACSACHALGGSVKATPSSATLAPGAAYTVGLAFTGGSSPVGYWISGNGVSVTASNAGPVSMTAPANAGSYTYTVWMRSGTSATTTYTITVAAPVKAPVASFTTSVASGDFPLPVTMTDTSTNTPTSWSWNLGDGTTSTLRNPAVTYATAGTKTVTLVATNAGGASAMVSKTITVTAPVPAPTASFTASAITGIAPLAVTFADTSTGAPTSWLWTFGNGATSNVQGPTAVTYAAAGTYTVTLIAGNASGASAPVTKTITVTAPTGTSAARISRISPDEARVGTKVTITGTGFGTVGVVKFGTVTATVLSYTNTSIVVSVPVVSREEVRVTVTPTGGTASNGVEFEVKGSHDGWDWGHFIGWLEHS